MRFTLSLIALAAVAAPVSANAQSGDETVTVAIDIADIDLASEQGRAVVEQRIATRIKQACTIEANSRYGYGRDIVDQTCVAKATAEARAKVERVAASDARQGRAVSAN